MDLNKLADILISDENAKTPDYYEKLYPERALPKGAEVTRLAPSPTGFMHLGNLYVAIANERIAHQSGGVGQLGQLAHLHGQGAARQLHLVLVVVGELSLGDNG